jgi:Domain of unknown function (DUF4398)
MRLIPFLLVLGACGPVEYIGQVTRRAASEVAAAKTAGADRIAPYEYTAAVEYLHKAREEAGYADFQAAIRFGKKSEALAKRAQELARAGAPPAVGPGAPGTAPSTVPPPPPTKPGEPGKFVPPEENE